MKDLTSNVLAGFALALAAATAFLFFREAAPVEIDSLEDELQLYREVRELIQENYVEKVEGEEMLRNALKGMVGRLDPYSRYYDGKEKEQLTEESTGKYVGIGIVIETSAPPITVLFPLEGSPAEKAGITVGDRILKVDGNPIQDLTVEAASEQIRGEEGTEVTLTILPASSGETKEVEVTRESIRRPTVTGVQLLDPKGKIGHLRISSFSQETVAEFDQAVAKLQKRGLSSLILDLRFNPGGVLDAAVKITNRFLKEGTIVSTRGRNPKLTKEHHADPDECHFDGLPLVVLINGESASAAEVVAGAVQDYRLGVLVGTTSYGKGVVQSLKSIEKGRGIVKLTTSYYYTPANRNFEKLMTKGFGGGIEPDLTISVPKATKDALRKIFSRFDVPKKYQALVEERRKKQNGAEESPEDPQLDAALALLQGKTPSSFLK